jgi:hypothetical protein
MNRLFVNIKVDREERPDLDAIYQSALVMLGEHGGWPLTMFLTPDGEPFWGGTYFPPAPRHGRPAFAEVLRAMHRAYNGEPEKIRASVDALRPQLARLGESQPGKELTMEAIDSLAADLVHQIDDTLGGLHGAPKFPHCPLFELLWRAYLRTGAPAFARAVLLTCEHMCQGGIYDHLGGGFARYATDPLWLVPHFEKMLYDNAQLIELLTLTWQHTRAPLFEARVHETVAWVLREMVADGGGFASTLDADNDGEEGRFYVWTEHEIEVALGAEAHTFKKAYDVSAGGNWEGRNILNRLRVPKLATDAEEARLPALRAILHRVREPRPRPGRDDKVLADWNGLMIAALASAGFVFDEPAWIDAARRAYRFVHERMADHDRLFHSYRLSRARHLGLLDDHANMARAALVLHELDGEGTYLNDARAWMATLDAHFWDHEGGGYFYTADDAASLVARTKTILDNALPSGNGVALGVLARLYLLTGDDAYRHRADHLVGAFSGHLDSSGLGLATFLNSFELFHDGLQIILVGDRKSPEIKAFLDVVRHRCPPGRVIEVVAPNDSLPIGHPASGKGQVAGKPTAYVCTGQTCSLPLTDPHDFARALPGVATPTKK